MNNSFSRRAFLRQGTLALASAGLLGRTSVRGATRRLAANDRLNIAMIGTANQAAYNLGNVASENIVALCDIDEKLLAAAVAKFPGATPYTDFRRALDRKDIDAVVVATPDHTHAVATAMALHGGRHVYCEKPLTRTISECRAIRELARRQKVATQMGTQIHAGNNYRRVVELVQSGAIGSVSEVHVWVGGGFGNKERPTETPPVPAHIHYEEWLGPVEYRPFSPEYIPFYWRNWWAFGGGTLADLGCHHVDLSHWALGLTTPETVEVLDGPKPHPESAPHYLIVRYTYAARGSRPPVVLTWYHGGKRPPQFAGGGLPKWGDGTLFVGEGGRMLLAGYDRHVLLPEKQFAGFQAPAPTIPNSIGHHKEWIQACKTGSPTTCNFDYSGALTEAVLLGNVAFRTGKKLTWDPRHLRAAGCREADEFIHHRFRKGWQL
ncbi:MAG TPA: oxidoreductase [Verrucomicrobiales bacterium]|nr:oxidoreductase [Verrucomicrobiales bacterium]